jgi:hypothetical protein
MACAGGSGRAAAGAGDARVCRLTARGYIECRKRAEGWPSGLRRTLGKRVYGKPYRGFESHSLRQRPSKHCSSVRAPEVIWARLVAWFFRDLWTCRMAGLASGFSVGPLFSGDLCTLRFWYTASEPPIFEHSFVAEFEVLSLHQIVPTIDEAIHSLLHGARTLCSLNMLDGSLQSFPPCRAVHGPCRAQARRSSPSPARFVPLHRIKISRRLAVEQEWKLGGAAGSQLLEEALGLLALLMSRDIEVVVRSIVLAEDDPVAREMLMGGAVRKRVKHEAVCEHPLPDLRIDATLGGDVADHRIQCLLFDAGDVPANADVADDVARCGKVLVPQRVQRRMSKLLSPFVCERGLSPSSTSSSLITNACSRRPLLISKSRTVNAKLIRSA